MRTQCYLPNATQLKVNAPRRGCLPKRLNSFEHILVDDIGTGAIEDDASTGGQLL